VKKFLIALQFLTILPIKIKSEIKERDFGASLVYFPIIGAFIGLLLVLIFIIFSFLPYLVKVALVLITYIIITGGMHLDGFADTCDGFYAGKSKEETLAIMRDPHIGTIGVIGLICLLLFKFVILISIPREVLEKSLIAMVVFGRWSQVFACYTSDYARQEGKARSFIEYAGNKGIFLATLFTLSVFFFSLKMKGLILFLASALPVFLFINFTKRKIGGMTGDTIGATNELAEAGLLFFNLIYGLCFY